LLHGVCVGLADPFTRLSRLLRPGQVQGTHKLDLIFFLPFFNPR
jgi:hypothetical protein